MFGLIEIMRDVSADMACYRDFVLFLKLNNFSIMSYGLI